MNDHLQVGGRVRARCHLDGDDVPLRPGVLTKCHGSRFWEVRFDGEDGDSVCYVGEIEVFEKEDEDE